MRPPPARRGPRPSPVRPPRRTPPGTPRWTAPPTRRRATTATPSSCRAPAFRCAPTCPSASRRCSPGGRRWTSGAGCATRLAAAPCSSCTTARPTRTGISTSAPRSTRSSRTWSTAPARWPGTTRSISPAGTATACRSSGRSRRSTASKGRDKDAVPLLDFRAECRAYAAHWMAVQKDEFRRLGVEGAWAERYATMDHPSEAAIAGEICKFLLNGALYRGLRPVMWSPVEKTALAEAEIEYHDHTSTTIWVRFPVTAAPAPDLADAALVIWTTTPWTMPGNRAIAAGEAIEYALIHVDTVAPGSLVRAGDKLVVALHLLPGFLTETKIATHHVVRLLPGAELAGTVCAHPLRGRGYDHDVPVLFGDFVTTEAGTGLVHIAPGHGEEDFLLGRAQDIAIPDTVGPDGTFNPWVPGFAGVHVYKAAEPVCAALTEAGGAARPRQPGAFLPAFLALQGAADLPRHAAMVHPHGRAGAHPRAGAGGTCRHRLRPRRRAQPHRLHGRRAPRLVHQPPARLGRADPGVRGPPHRRAVARSRGRSAYRRGLRRRGGGRLVCVPAGPVPGSRPHSRRLRTGARHRRCLVRVRLDPRLHPGSARPALAGRSLPGRFGPASRLVPFLPAGSDRHPRAGARSGRS